MATHISYLFMDHFHHIFDSPFYDVQNETNTKTLNIHFGMSFRMVDPERVENLQNGSNNVGL